MIKFGTDGWRGIIADDFTVENVRYCAQATAEHLLASGDVSGGVVIGYDTRFASERFAAVVAEVMAGNGIAVRLCDKAVPTPVVSFGVMLHRAAGGVVITASHNPGDWNGFKIKSGIGASAPPEVEADIENRLPEILAEKRVKSVAIDDAVRQGTVEYVDLFPVYAGHIGTLVDLDALREAGAQVLVDSMFGAGSGYFRYLLSGGATNVLEINGERNPVFPGMKQPEPIAANLSMLCDAVRSNGASIGLATDGDADRIGVVNELGKPLTPLQIFGLLALYLLEVRGERGAMVRTITTTDMVNKLADLYKVPVFETRVGFKHVAPVMLRENAMVGGEESSGFGYRGHIPERDGILSGLYILDLMAKVKKTPTQLIQHLYDMVGPHHYKRKDVEFPREQRDEIIGRLTGNIPSQIAGVEVKQVNTVDGHHFRLVDGSWVLVRFSGTEPLLRIYAEAESLERAEGLVGEMQKTLGVQGE